MPSLDKGYYWGKVKEFGTAESDKGTPYFFLTCEIVAVRVGQEYIDIAPEERTVFIYLSDAAMQYSAPKLISIGFNGNFAAPDIGEDAKTNGVMLENEPETFDGKLREKWQLYTQRGIEHKPLDNAGNRRLNALYKNEIAKGPVAPAPTPTPAAVPADVPSGPMDDPPF